MKVNPLLVLLALLTIWCVFQTTQSVAATGAENSVILGGLSYHVKSDDYLDESDGIRKDLNEVHRSIGFRHGSTEIAVGYIHENSYENKSVYVIYNPRWEVAHQWHVGVRLGAATGYDNTPIDMEVAPVIGAEVTLDTGPITFNLGVMAPEVISFHMEIDFE